MQARVTKAIAVGRAGAALLVFFSLCVAACSSSHSGKDAGATNDGGKATDAGGSGGLIRRRDAQAVSGDPLPSCTRFDPTACGPGQQCRLVIRRAADAGGFLIYPGCVEGVAARRLGAPCDPWGGETKPYTASGLMDEVYVDPCEAGLYCAPDPKIRDHFSCQTSCESGRRPGQTEIVDCPSPTQYCTRASTMATGLEEFCRESDICDPSDPGSCGPSRGCYLRLDDAQTGVLTVCLPVSDPPLADGEVCTSLNDCNPGSSCWGPTRTPPGRWKDTDLMCRRSCNVSASGTASDAGDDDAGSGRGTGACRGGTSCVSFMGSGLELSSVSVPLGQCE